MSPERPKTGDDTEVLTRERTATPKRYSVMLYNDEYTTMEFVVEVLESLFKKSPAEATQVMLRVHKHGKGVAGVYTRDVAETKVTEVHEMAKTEGFPLRAGLEEA